MEQELTTQTLEQDTANETAVVKTAKKAYSKSFLNLGLFSVITVSLQLGLSFLFAKLFPDTEGAAAENASYLISFLTMYAIAFPIYVVLNRKMELCPPKQEKMTPGWFFVYLLIGRAVAMVGTYISMLVTAIVAKLSDVNVEDTTLTDAVMGENPTLILIFAVFGAPIVEELMFRKILIDRIRKYGDGKAIVLSGVLFGVFHGNVTQMFYAAALGLMLAYVYVKTGKVIHTILLHMAFNFLGAVAPLLFHADELMKLLADPSAQNFSESNLIMSGIFVLINYSMVIAGAILLVVLIAKGQLFQIEKPVQPLPERKNFSVPCLNLGMLVFTVTVLAVFAYNIFG